MASRAYFHAMTKPYDVLFLSQAAKVAGLSHSTLRVQIRNGSLAARKLGRDWVVTRKELDRYLRENAR